MVTRNINVSHYDDEYALFGKALPYIAMLVGAGLTFLLAVITRVGMWAQDKYNDTVSHDSAVLITWIIVISCILLSALAWKLFRPRDQFHHHISWHALITTVLVHAWLLMAVWQDLNEWMFGIPTVYTFFFGGAVLGISWCIRRWSYRGDVQESVEKGSSDIWEVIGLGKAQSPDRILGLKSIRKTIIKLRLATSSFLTWTTVKLSKMRKRNFQK